MLNDYEVPGQTMPGLTLAEVQQLMGHRDVNTTRKYARERTSRLQAKLQAHDLHFIQGEALPPGLALPSPPAVPLIG